MSVVHIDSTRPKSPSHPPHVVTEKNPAMTKDPAQVTCGICKRTTWFKSRYGDMPAA